MKQKKLTVIRNLCMFLCFLMLLGTVFTMVSCNKDTETEEPTETETTTDKATETNSQHELNENGMVEIVVFKTDAPTGTKITSKMLETIEVSPENLPKNVVTDTKNVKGKYTKKDFYKGDYVIASRLTNVRPLEINEDVIKQEIKKSNSDFLVVTDYIKPNTGKDLADNLQILINLNPGRTIYFPDGEYIISRSLKTSCDPKKTTSFYFSSGAILRASDDWKEENMLRALICLGAIETKKVNDIRTPGSNFYVMGGIFDGNGVADGISIDAGRETLIKDVVIVNTRIGVHVKSGTNNNSSDSDIDDVTIVGNGRPNSYGILMVGLDNTITNARISNVQVGMQVSAGVFVSNCTVENPENIYGVCGFANAGDAWFSDCTAIDCDVAFLLGKGFYKQCMAKWTKNDGETSIAFKREGGALYAFLMGCKAEFVKGEGENIFLSANAGGTGRVIAPVFDISLCTNDSTHNYLESGTSIISPATAPEKED